MTNLSKEYETIIPYKVNYINLPKYKLFQSPPEAFVQLRVKGTGFQLLKEQLASKEINIDLRTIGKKEKYRYYLNTRKSVKDIEMQMDRTVKLLSFVKDTLFFNLGKNTIKKVPVITNFDLKFKKGYNFSKRLQISPDSITVSGPESQVAKIRTLTTLPYAQSQISEDVVVSVDLALPKEVQGIRFSDKKITLRASVEKFTEDSFLVPFTVNGLPENTSITTYPKMVEVVFQVGMSSYKQITAKDFKIVCNYKYSQESKRAYLLPELMKQPSVVSSVRIIPNQIEYLIQK
ncbi:MAG: CdaR family protein [Flavicella sp.]